MKISNTQLLAALAIGLAGFWFISQRNQQLAPAFRQAPPEPPRQNTQEWQTWVATILALYGSAKELWEPGGPFYKHRNDEIFDEVNPGDTSNIV